MLSRHDFKITSYKGTYVKYKYSYILCKDMNINIKNRKIYMLNYK